MDFKRWQWDRLTPKSDRNLPPTQVPCHFPRTGHSDEVCVLESTSKGLSNASGSAFDTRDCCCGAAPAPGPSNCISHQAAVPLSSDLAECRLACVFQGPNKQIRSTTNFCIWIWSLEVSDPRSSGPAVKLDGSPLCKRGTIEAQMARVEGFPKDCPLTAQLPNHVPKVSKFLLLE